MIEQPTYFGYDQLYRSVRQSLPPDLQLAFVEAVEAYGFERKEPNFAPDSPLAEAWAKVLSKLESSWKARENGHNGGKVSAAKRLRPQDMKRPADALAMPDDAPPSEEFVEFLKGDGWPNISAGNGAINARQLRYLLAAYGNYAACYALAEVEAMGAQRAGDVFGLAKARLDGMEAAFIAWHDKRFSKLANYAPAQKITLKQYTYLRAEFGRRNVVQKLDQINKYTRLNMKADEYGTLASWLSRSFSQPPSSPFSMSYNDSAMYDAGGYPMGWDAPFSFDPHSVKLITDKRFHKIQKRS